MASSKDAALYGSQRQRKLTGGKEISSSNSLSFTSQLSSLISSSASQPKSRATTSSSSSQRLKPKKDDIFHASSARNSAKRAKRESSNNDNSSSTAQKHSTSGESLDADIWQRSKRKMEEKARLYAAMKRGDIEDLDEKYDVDFDRKWAEKTHDGEALSSSSDDGDSDEDESAREIVEYIDEFGRTRKGTRTEADRAQRVKQGQQERVEQSDRFTARPSAPSQVIYGDTIQHAAFEPEAGVAAQMAELARKRDKELTPPPEEHFDASREVREKGTGFFRFSNDEGERKRQMEGLDADRRETERKRMEREGKIEERKRVLEERRREIIMKRGKRKADDFLVALGEELSQKPDASAAGEGTDGEK